MWVLPPMAREKEAQVLPPGHYEGVQIAGGTLAFAIKLAVAAFQRKHEGALPQYVWCPEGSALTEDVIVSWRQRGVIVAPHKDAQGGVFAGPRVGEVVECPN